MSYQDRTYYYSRTRDYEEVNELEKIALDTSQIKDGDLVAVERNEIRGVALMMNSKEYYVSWGLVVDSEGYDIDFQGCIQYGDRLYAPTKKDALNALYYLYEEYEKWPNGGFDDDGPHPPLCALRAMDATVRQSLENLKKALDDQRDFQERVIKQWQEELENTRRRNEETFDRQEGEIHELNAELFEKRKRIDELEDEVSRLKEIPTEGEFVKRFIEEAKVLFKNERAKADGIRQVFAKMKMTEAAEGLDEWIENANASKIINNNFGEGSISQVNNGDVKGDVIINSNKEE